MCVYIKFHKISKEQLTTNDIATDSYLDQDYVPDSESSYSDDNTQAGGHKRTRKVEPV